jgi:peptidoglycan hydrolase CwlO-like protein
LLAQAVSPAPPIQTREKIVKTTAIHITLCFLAFVCLTVHKAFAQTSTQSSPAARADSDQVLKDILNEVRQLRADLLRLNVNAHRTQALLDRMKLQQEQVVRLTRELGHLRDELASIRSRQVKMKDHFEHLEKQQASGLVGQNEVKAVAAELEELKQREQTLTEREPSLSADSDHRER